ncbi:MAG: protein kinase [Acidobacteriota bacterium]|nr:protein kinase [Acidobacteriota bacterium]
MQTIGKYEVLEVIGHGGMGVVYRARDAAIGRHVALKVMGAALAQQGELRERFLREARAAGNLQHPNIVVIYDLGEDNGAPYIAMEYLAGEPLDKALAANTLTTKAKLEIFALICDGLHFAHQSGVIHRDVKPANVILPTKGGAKLVDFGIARTGDAGITRTGMMIGTVAYMAPEQLKAKPVDARSDVFSAGAMLYEMLAGKLPFEGESTAETMMRILQEEPPELKAEGVVSPQSLAKLVGRALEKEPADRYQTAREFGEAVRDYLLAQELSGMRATSIRPLPDVSQLREPAATVAPAPTRMSAAPPVSAPKATAMDPAAQPAHATRATSLRSGEGRGSGKKVMFIAAALIAIFVVALVWSKRERQDAQSAASEVTAAATSLGAAPGVTPASPANQPAATAPASSPASTPTPTPAAPVVKSESKQAEPTPAKLVPTPPLPTMQTTASGVKYWDTKEGTGAVATKGKTVTVLYSGHLTDGTPFGSANAGKPFEFPLGKGMMIKGWEEGIEGMKVGGKRRLRVPPEAGYGATGIGGEIPPNSTLIFDVQLLAVK